MRACSAIQQGDRSNLLPTPLERLFFDCTTDFAQVFPKGVTRIRCALLQVLRKLQLFPQ
jgi:hypothetical protein